MKGRKRGTQVVRQEGKQEEGRRIYGENKGGWTYGFGENKIK